MTAGATDAEHRQCRELGANRILTKPVDTHELRSVLAEWLPPEIMASAGGNRRTEEPEHPQALDPELIEIFLRESDSRVAAIRGASTSQHDRLQIARNAHTLSSTTQYVGDTATSLAAKRVESLARGGEMTDLEPAIKELVAAYDNLHERLQEGLAGLSASGNTAPDEPSR